MLVKLKNFSHFFQVHNKCIVCQNWGFTLFSSNVYWYEFFVLVCQNYSGTTSGTTGLFGSDVINEVLVTVTISGATVEGQTTCGQHNPGAGGLTMHPA